MLDLKTDDNGSRLLRTMTVSEGISRFAANRGLRGFESGEEDSEYSADVNSLGKVGGYLEDQSQNIRINLLAVA